MTKSCGAGAFSLKLDKNISMKGQFLFAQGFHFCKDVPSINGYYTLKDSRVCEVEAIGKVISESEGDKSVTNHIKILRELSRQEIFSLANIGKDNTGINNSGDSNSGHSNSGSFCSCNNSAGLFMSKHISYEAFNKLLTESEYNTLTDSLGYAICCGFKLVRYRVRTETGKYGDFRYMSYKASWRVFWNNLTFAERNAVRNMPYIDKGVFEEITGVKL